MGDAELDEGNVFETLMETWKLNVTNNWFIIDYNRQSLDKIMEEKSYRVIDKMFRTTARPKWPSRPSTSDPTESPWPPAARRPS